MNSQQHGRPALSEFLAELARRWEGLTLDDLLAVLLDHARRLPARDRQEFLDIFPGSANLPNTSPEVARQELLDRIGEFADRVAAGEYAGDEEFEDYSGYSGYSDGYAWRDDEAAPWVPEAERLFADIGDVFVTDDLETARTAYERLLATFGLGVGADGVLEMWRLESTDVPETLARYLRCVYETTPVAKRPTAVHAAYLCISGRDGLTLANLSTSRPNPLPDLEAFLPGWIEALLGAPEAQPERQLVALLVEAATLRGGVDELAGLARRPGPHQGGVGLARIDALTAAGRWADARSAAQETLADLAVRSAHKAEAADRLADLNLRLEDVSGALAARRRAWSCGPTRVRLLALASAGRAAGVQSEVLVDEADALLAAGRPVTDRLGCELLLLAGRLDDAVSALRSSNPLGWSRATHPGPVVLPFLWAAALGAAPAEASHVGRMFADIDRDRDPLGLFDPWIPTGGDPSGRDGRSDDATLSLTTLLVDVVRSLDVDADRRDRYLGIAAEVADARINAIVSGKHRGAYERAAQLAHAHAEILTSIGRVDEGRVYLAAVRGRFPRHVAFRGELDAAAKASARDARR